jgi:hypothetical protein
MDIKKLKYLTFNLINLLNCSMFASIFIITFSCTQTPPKGNDSGGDQSLYDVPTFPIGVSTLAGSGEFTSIDGQGSSASFSEPRAIVLHRTGGLIVVESGSGAIRVLDFDGTVRSIVFTGIQPLSAGGLSIDGNDSLYVSDPSQHCILKIEDGLSEVFGGSCGTSGYQDGSVALFNAPQGLDFDAEGNLIVADAQNNRIRSISPEGLVSTVAGVGGLLNPTEGPVEVANVYLPYGVAVHPNNQIFFSGLDQCIRRINEGQVENIAGLCQNFSNEGSMDGSASNARFNHPLNILFGSDSTLYISESNNDRIRILSSDLGTVSTLSGSLKGFKDGSHAEALFDHPHGLAIDHQGNIYVADGNNQRIRVITPQ